MKPHAPRARGCADFWDDDTNHRRRAFFNGAGSGLPFGGLVWLFASVGETPSPFGGPDFSDGAVPRLGAAQLCHLQGRSAGLVSDLLFAGWDFRRDDRWKTS